MSVQTNITGKLYKPDGTLIEAGNLNITLSKPFVSIDGYQVQPFKKTISISTGGSISLSVFATENTVVGSSYTALTYSSDRTYTIEYDPTPSTSRIFGQVKDGYFQKTLSIPHVSDTPANNNYALSTTGTVVKTAITGSLYKSTGALVTSGKLYIKPYAHFTAIDGTLVAPFTIEYTVTGALSFSLFATENTVAGSAHTAKAAGSLYYTMEFDPAPLTTTTFRNRKDGYFKNTISVPHVSDTPGSNTKNIKDIVPLEYSDIQKKYGYGNILDNSDTLLTLVEKTNLTDGGNAGSAHSHGETNLSYLIFEDQDTPPDTPAADHIKLYFSKDGSNNGILHLLMENAEDVYLMQETVV